MSPINFSELLYKVAGLFVLRASGHHFDAQRNFPAWELKNQVLHSFLQQGLGGIIFHGGSSIELLHRCKALQQLSEKPLLFCADVEEGLGQRFGGGTWLSPPMSLAHIYKENQDKAIKLAEQYGRCTGYQARRSGLNWVLAPVCDINTNPLNPVINVRAWGSESATVSKLTCAFHRGLVSEGILSCAKHFPGHGDTGIDSHLQLPELDHDFARLDQVELEPFRAIISEGVSSIMVGHLFFKRLDAKYPSTMSKFFINQLLRKKLGFQGLIVTDALVMKSISNRYDSAESAILALEAGVDVILMPDNPNQAINGVCQAVLSGRLSLNQLEESLERRNCLISKISDFKEDSPLNAQYPESFQELEREEDRGLALELVKSSIQISKGNSIQSVSNGINLIRVDNILKSNFLNDNSPSICLPEDFGYKTIILDKDRLEGLTNQKNIPLDVNYISNESILIQLFIRGNPFLGDPYNINPWLLTIDQLQNEHLLKGLILYGSPYIWEQLVSILNPEIPIAFSPSQRQEAQFEALSSLFSDCESTSYFEVSSIDEFTD